MSVTGCNLLRTYGQIQPLVKKMTVLRILPLKEGIGKTKQDDLKREVDDLLLDLSVLSDSLKTITALMMDTGNVYRADSMGSIIEHYNELIFKDINRLEEISYRIFS